MKKMSGKKGDCGRKAEPLNSSIVDNSFCDWKHGKLPSFQVFGRVMRKYCYYWGLRPLLHCLKKWHLCCTL